jgi:hypothetical protein
MPCRRWGTQDDFLVYTNEEVLLAVDDAHTKDRLRLFRGILFVVLRGLRRVAVAAQPGERLGHFRLVLRGIVGAFADAELKVVAAQLQGIVQPRIRVAGRFVGVVLALLAVEVRPSSSEPSFLRKLLCEAQTLDQRAVDGEVIVRHEALGLRDHRREELMRDLRRQQ